MLAGTIFHGLSAIRYAEDHPDRNGLGQLEVTDGDQGGRSDGAAIHLFSGILAGDNHPRSTPVCHRSTSGA